MVVTQSDLTGQLEGFPIEVVEKMLERQFEQTGRKEVAVFQDFSSNDHSDNGFDWDKTVEGDLFWSRVISDKKFNIFFDRYPKKDEYPKLMWVWDNMEDVKLKRVVFMEKNGKYLAWDYAETLEDVEDVIETTDWTHAEDIIEPPKINIAPEVKKETCIKIIAEDKVILETKVPMMAFFNMDNQLHFTQNIEIKIT